MSRVELLGEVTVGPRTLLHNGDRTDHLSDAVGRADLAADRLSVALGVTVHVRPVIVVVGAAVVVEAPPHDVAVVALADVRRWLESRPTVLATLQVVMIARLARLAAQRYAPPADRPCSANGTGGSAAARLLAPQTRSGDRGQVTRPEGPVAQRHVDQ
ncbi:MAG: hypothetical protein M3N57_00565 [Actinomycetota bacterium]|nr:hypothetical protein [Actinomycetota bacterium]